MIDKRLTVIVGRAAGTNLSAKLEASSLHTASSGAQAGAFRDRPSFNDRLNMKTLPSAMSILAGAHDLRGHSGYIA